MHAQRIISTRTFGRRVPALRDALPFDGAVPAGLWADLRLFALTFSGGLLFMTVYLA